MTQSPASAAQAARAISVLSVQSVFFIATRRAAYELWQQTARHRLRGGNYICGIAVRACRRHPGRLNTRFRTAATTCRGGELPRLWSSSSLSVIVSDDGGVAIAALRQSTSTMPPVERKCAAQAATHFRFIRLIRGVDCYTQCCALPGEQKKAAEAAFKLWIN